MPRRRRRRRVGRKPDFSYFEPRGKPSGEEEIILKVEEFEAIRLKDFQGLNQEEAAAKMDISQPTFHRTLVSARRKIADALVNGKAIKVKGGDYILPSNDSANDVGSDL